MIEGRATARYVRTSAQKAKLVIDLIRGQEVDAALATLRFTRKGAARDVEKVLRSAIANAHQKQGGGGEVERLYVRECYADQGPSLKRIRAAPMGRAFRILKRTSHLTVVVEERPEGRASRTRRGRGGPGAGGVGGRRRERPAALRAPEAVPEPEAPETGTPPEAPEPGAAETDALPEPAAPEPDTEAPEPEPHDAPEPEDRSEEPEPEPEAPEPEDRSEEPEPGPDEKPEPDDSDEEPPTLPPGGILGIR